MMLCCNYKRNRDGSYSNFMARKALLFECWLSIATSYETSHHVVRATYAHAAMRTGRWAQ